MQKYAIRSRFSSANALEIIGREAYSVNWSRYSLPFMSWYTRYNSSDDGRNAQRQMEKRAKKGEHFEPLKLPAGQRTKISVTYWGQAWCRHLESFSDYENRLPRGRSYLRKGSVYNLDVTAGQIAAVVAGSSLYETSISITPLPKDEWKRLVRECSGNIESVFDLLAGKLGEQTLRLLTDPTKGLFPRPRQMRFACSCPDWADMCKHVAAVLYGVGTMLDQKPELLFVLRGVDQAELIGHATGDALQSLGQPTADQPLGDTDLSALFGIDLATDDPEVFPASVAAEPGIVGSGKKAAKKKTAKEQPVKKKAAKKAAKKKSAVKAPAKKARPKKGARKKSKPAGAR